MEKWKLKNKLEELEEMERAGHTDAFRFISANVNAYRRCYGSDEWIETFVYEYMHERFKNRGKH